MKKPQLNNKGFGLAGILVVIVVLAAIGGTGAYIYHRNHQAKTSTTSSASNTTSTQASTGNSTSKSNPVQHTSADALALVQSAYTTALAYEKQTTRADQGEIDSIKTSLSTSLYSKLSTTKTDHDQILCGQMRPSSFTTSLGSSTNNTATVFVNELYGSTPVKVTTTVDLGTLKLTDITCQQ